MMSLANRLEHYLTVRRRFDTGLSTGERELRQFAAFADAEDAAWIGEDVGDGALGVLGTGALGGAG